MRKELENVRKARERGEVRCVMTNDTEAFKCHKLSGTNKELSGPFIYLISFLRPLYLEVLDIIPSSYFAAVLLFYWKQESRRSPIQMSSPLSKIPFWFMFSALASTNMNFLNLMRAGELQQENQLEPVNKWVSHFYSLFHSWWFLVVVCISQYTTKNWYL